MPGVRRLRCSRDPSGQKNLRLVTWNVNSVRQRLPLIERYIQEYSPDVLALQEIKCQQNDFPAETFSKLGYHHVHLGQKSYNGVATLSKHPMTNVEFGLKGPEDDEHDPQARYVQCSVQGIAICNLYHPNGNPVGSEKFDYRLRWSKLLYGRVKSLTQSDMPLVLMGDFNTVPRDEDCYDIIDLSSDAVVHPHCRSQYRSLVYQGLYDALQIKPNKEKQYSYWDYRAGSWEKNKGMRIDHILLSPHLADRFVQGGVHKEVRGWQGPSDHAPVWADIRRSDAMSD
ncbi:hypothetical protein GUITHDRAFT_65587 [Guillardia theta CCMP2712]|uniref:Endonuclease/exonuclease/phosphatase domain-containing protein n=1 Tax=Guillardia theta (strain CCMP2712) TaxID=905079 RepID=L1JU99_GUITC|nr:hypothetical protein GUITHDRAFT_65587 [Guillardia theta CCMP2712]EKX51874.1 hypothetical protein GUITHDRAFT_65587 [Guillardia theta CCMP2712]|eukprot:XP_005838854.1 hypothetical protein GUITHDRAFT_65587 [Guillardia theta CCMP2712]